MEEKAEKQKRRQKKSKKPPGHWSQTRLRPSSIGTAKEHVFRCQRELTAVCEEVQLWRGRWCRSATEGATQEKAARMLSSEANKEMTLETFVDDSSNQRLLCKKKRHAGNCAGFYSPSGVAPVPRKDRLERMVGAHPPEQWRDNRRKKKQNVRTLVC